MFIKEVIIDGFKSYAQRTVIGGWDSTFNAITGLNGSGKSNVLDAICFVLGITNLSQVRASNLTDLVYKSGQSGVTKATVSLVFDNSDTAGSPIGYEHCDSITVTRTIVMGGRNKYLINGHVVQASAVQNLFHSVQLNVNNPHFLIMQGRITKVLNMKPPEILSMIEETAGTRMFEAKKQAAIKTIEKKQSKVEEIDKILSEDINPTLEKLRGERKAYLEWARNNTDCERLARFCVAYEYATALSTSQDAASKQAELGAAINAALAKAKELKAVVAGKEAELKSREAERAAAMSGHFKQLVDTEESVGKAYAQASAVAENQKKAVKAEEVALAAFDKAMVEAEAALAALLKQMKQDEANRSVAADAAKQASAEVESLMAKVNAAKAGLAIDDATGAGSTIADQQMAAKGLVAKLTTDISSAEMRMKHLKASLKEVEKAARAASADHAALVAAMQKTSAAVETKKAKLVSINFNASVEEALKAKREHLVTEISKLEDLVESKKAGLAALFDLPYDAASMGPGFNPSSIKGTVAQLFRLKDERAATALEIAASGKLFQVVLDDEVVGKQLLEKGRLKRRITIIPLNKVKRSTIPKAKVDLAASISKGLAVPAISLIDFDESVRAAMEYTFGGFFVCRTAEVAKAITFHPHIAVPCVTYDGDMFDPAGTLEGGSKPDMAGEPMLVRASKVAVASGQLTKLQTELDEVDLQLNGMAKASAAYRALTDEIDLATHELSLQQQRVSSSQLSLAEAKLRDTSTAVAEEESKVTSWKAQLKDAQEKVKELELSLANMAKAREAQVTALTRQLDAAKKKAASFESDAKAAHQKFDKTSCDYESALQEQEQAKQAYETAATALETSRQDMNKTVTKCMHLEARYQEAKLELDKARESIASNDKAMKAIIKERDAAVRSAEDLEAEAKKLDAKQKTIVKDATIAAKSVQDLTRAHGWIETEKEFFGKPHTDYDFEATDPRTASAKLTALEKKQGELERKINKKVIGMIEQAEREYADLVNKKRIIENDKFKIEKVMSELDEKKNEALRTTWAKVNKDFGSIFSMLLPGVTAKLDPPEGGTVLDGLEVKVAFNGVWKESLTELSGGQRSLLALSLILSLLLFKPAPMYILDEVDAALDLSHTQNIGHMIKTYFGKSQFIVVSLKQGMFNNANVIFRTKFVEGIGSTVTRTLPSPTDAADSSRGAGKTKSEADVENTSAAMVTSKRAAAGAGARGVRVLS